MDQENKAAAPMEFNPESGLVLRHTDDMKMMAAILLREGLVPKALKTVGQVIICLQTGAEVGMTYMQSLKYIAPINGSPTIWGEGAKGLVHRTGKVEEWEDWWEVDGERIEGDPLEFVDSTTACTRIKRKGSGEVTRRFSVTDAKRANLWSKLGPWSQYPKRMLQVRAMTYAMRDLFADALGGLGIAEEVIDTPEQAREPEWAPVADIGPKSDVHEGVDAGQGFPELCSDEEIAAIDAAEREAEETPADAPKVSEGDLPY